MSFEIKSPDPNAPPGENSIHWKGNVCTIGGEPELVLSLSIPFLTISPELWKDRIALARRYGANTVELDIASADADPNVNIEEPLEAFLTECDRQRLYVIIRASSNELAPIAMRHLWAHGGTVILFSMLSKTNAESKPEIDGEAVWEQAVREQAALNQSAGHAAYAFLRRCAAGAGSSISLSALSADALINDSGWPTASWRSARRIALWAHTFRHILLHGKHRMDIPASSGLRVTELATRENGAIIFVDNPSETETVDGYVPPYLPEVTLGPQELFAYVHDAPIGPADAGGRYLASYVGLVKSDAPILAAHIRPDPMEGARLYVYGEPGDTREVVLFHGAERGQATMVTFAEAPEVYPVGPSQIIALSTELAGRTFFPDDDFAPVLIGPHDVLDHGSEFATILVSAKHEHIVFSLAADGGITTIDVVSPSQELPGRDNSVAIRIAL